MSQAAAGGAETASTAAANVAARAARRHGLVIRGGSSAGVERDGALVHMAPINAPRAAALQSILPKNQPPAASCRSEAGATKVVGEVDIRRADATPGRCDAGLTRRRAGAASVGVEVVLRVARDAGSGRSRL